MKTLEQIEAQAYRAIAVAPPDRAALVLKILQKYRSNVYLFFDNVFGEGWAGANFYKYRSSTFITRKVYTGY